MTSVCEICPLLRTGVCAQVIGVPPKPDAVALRKTGKAASRRYLQKAETPSDTVKVIRHGWAASVNMSPEGRRQVFDILLPGDPIGGAILSYGVKARTVQAITEVDYCEFDVEYIRDLINANEEIRQFTMDVTYGLLLSVQARLFDMASREGEGRVLKFILDIYDRLVSLDLAKDGVCEFPLRQKTIADAVGLTEVHVNRVMSSLRARKIMWIDSRVLHIASLGEVRKLIA